MGLNVGHKVADAHAECFGNPIERIQGNGISAAFDITDIGRMEVCQLRQFLLGQACPFPIDANCFSDCFAVFRCDRHKPVKQPATSDSFHRVNSVSA